MRRREERIVSVVNGETIVSEATNESNGKEGSKHNTRVREAVLSIPHIQQGRMKNKSKDLSFIHGPFEGRFNPKIGLSPFIS